MKKKIKNWALNILSNYFQIKELEYYYGQNPYNVFLGENSYFEKPRQINGGEYIIIGNTSSIGHSAWLGAFDCYLNQKFNPEIKIGNNVKIGNYACITAIDKIIIHDGCLISEYVYISDHYHGFDPKMNIEPAKQPLFSKGEVIIGANTFIGYRVTILSGVTLGKNCVVGAHSVVNKSFPDYSMIAGVPAKIIKKFSFEKQEWIEINLENEDTIH